MVEKTVTIAIDANIDKFKKSLGRAEASAKASAGRMKTSSDKASAGAKSTSKSATNASETSKANAGFSKSTHGMSSKFNKISAGASKFGKTAKSLGIKAGGIIKKFVEGVKKVIAVYKKLLSFSGKFAKLFDPLRYDKNLTKLEEHFRKFGTALGALMSPVFETLVNVASTLLNVATSIITALSVWIALSQGLFNINSNLNESLSETADEMDEAGSSASEGLAAFDKLNTLDISALGDVEEAEKLTSLIATAKVVGSTIPAILGGAIVTFGETAWNCIKIAGEACWNGIKSIGETAWNGIKSVGESAWNGLRQVGEDAWNGLKSVGESAWNSIKSVGETAWNGISSGASDLWADFTSVGESAWNSLKSTAEDIWDAIYSPIKDAIDWIVSKIEWVADKLGIVTDSVNNITGGTSITEHISNGLGSVANWLGFARGGVFQPNSPQLAILGDNKTEPEVVAPRSMILDAVRQAMAESNGGSNNSVGPINLQIDGKTFARYTYNDIKNESRRRGGNLI
ncbi:MAG: hypothetical protein WC082_07980 [Victivallales bacterium]